MCRHSSLLYLGSHIWKIHLSHDLFIFFFCKRLSRYSRNILFHFLELLSRFPDKRAGPRGDSWAEAWTGWAWQARRRLDSLLQAGDRFRMARAVLMATGSQRLQAVIHEPETLPHREQKRKPKCWLLCLEKTQYTEAGSSKIEGLRSDYLFSKRISRFTKGLSADF